MKILAWIIAAIVLLVIVSGLVSGLALFTIGTLTQKQEKTFDRVDPESVPESVRKLPVDWTYSASIPKSVPDASPEAVPESVRKLPVQNIKESISYNADYSFEARLQEATLIDGLPCAAGIVQFTKSGQLYKCTLAEDAVINGNLIPYDTVVELRKDGHSYGFPKDMEFQGYLCKTLRDPIGHYTRFYLNGRLERFASPSDIMVQGIPCRKSSSGIALYENGNLKECMLSDDAKIEGRSIPAMSTVYLSEDGKLRLVDNRFVRRYFLKAMNSIFGY